MQPNCFNLLKIVPNISNNFKWLYIAPKDFKVMKGATKLVQNGLNWSKFVPIFHHPLILFLMAANGCKCLQMAANGSKWLQKGFKLNKGGSNWSKLLHIGPN